VHWLPNPVDSWLDSILPDGKSRGHAPSEFDPEQLAVGTTVELEHTKVPEIAMRIAMDHLTEDPDYYRKLRALGL
jgi:uncharacterized protein DUF5661